MKKSLPFLAIGLFVIVLVPFAPLPDQAVIAVRVIAAVLALVIAIGLFQGGGGEKTSAAPAAEPSRPAPAPQVKGSAEAEVITLLSRMQEKGRLIDFLMDDISAHDDATIGAAARVVYQGCRAVLDEHFEVEPVESAAEGGKVEIPEGYDAGLYRLTGNLSGSAPFKGTLVHKGWKVTSAKLPKVLASESGELPPLAPAQVEV